MLRPSRGPPAAAAKFDFHDDALAPQGQRRRFWPPTAAYSRPREPLSAGDPADCALRLSSPWARAEIAGLPFGKPGYSLRPLFVTQRIERDRVVGVSSGFCSG